MTNYDTDHVATPGDILQAILDHRRQHAASFARLVGLPLGTVLGILDGITPITDSIAEALAHGTDTSAQCWVRRDRHYRNTR